uniref:Uncharacterized protein n=1 Tax=Anopheles dirus TaxID=7168 RepID=A0A182NWK2_9DIPT
MGSNVSLQRKCVFRRARRDHPPSFGRHRFVESETAQEATRSDRIGYRTEVNFIRRLTRPGPCCVVLLPNLRHSWRWRPVRSKLFTDCSARRFDEEIARVSSIRSRHAVQVDDPAQAPSSWPLFRRTIPKTYLLPPCED